MKNKTFGFTLIEILVVISIISILSAVIYASFGDARENSRDKVRKTSLKELALHLELYKSKYGQYPAQGCGVTSGWTGPGPQDSSNTDCDEYIVGLVPEFMAELPTDPNQENELNKGFMYQVRSSAGGLRDRYKAMVQGSVESDLVNDFNNEFARCPSALSGPCASGVPDTTYAIYSPGAEDW
jgi:prepilin-type N-terminal cleavage/methylation domain-containing protein